MLKDLTRYCGLFLVLLYMGGAFLVPTIHKTHCEEHATAGDDFDCPVCQMANTPWVAPVSPGAPQPVAPADTVVFPALLSTVVSPFLSPTLARGPPVS